MEKLPIEEELNLYIKKLQNEEIEPRPIKKIYYYIAKMLPKQKVAVALYLFNNI